MLLRLLCAVLLVGVLVGPAHAFTTDSQEDICATAAVIVCDNFENRSTGSALTNIIGGEYKNPGWDVSDGSMSVVNTQAFDGTKSLDWTYPSGTGGAGYFNVTLAGRRDYYVRFYMKNQSNWVWSDNGNKMAYIGGPTHPDNLIFDQAVFGGNIPVWRPQFANVDGPFNWPNAAGFSWPLNEWVCVEFHATASSSPGGSDGAFEGWMNGVLTYSNPNINIDTVDTTLTSVKFSGYYNNDGGISHPEMHRWIDNIVISTQRIGCLGAAPVPDTVPPSQVISMAASAASATGILITHAASTDAVGVVGYDYQRCTGAACTNFSLVASNNALTYTDTGLTASTLYRYRAYARDAAGNISAPSSIVEATTLSSGAAAIAFVGSTLSSDNQSTSAVDFDVTTPGGNDRLMVACLMARDSVASDLSATSVTYNNLPLTKIRSDEANWGGTAHARIEQWRLIAPPVGTYPFNAQWANVIPSEYAVAGVSLYTGVDQLNPVEAHNGASGNSGTASVSITSITDHAALVDCADLRDDAGPTIGAGQVQRIRNEFGVSELTRDWMASSTVIDKTPVGAETMDWTQAAAYWISNAIALKPAVAAVAPVITSFTPDATGANVTYGATTPTSIRVQIYSTTATLSDVVEPISAFPGGRYTRTWPQGSQSACLFAIDAAGVESTASDDYLCTTLSGLVQTDTTPPVISAGAPTTELAAGTTGITESVATDEVARCRRSLTDQAYSAMTNQMSTVNGRAHTWAATGLANNTSYPIYVRCTDQYDAGLTLPNNPNTSSYTFTYSVAAAGGDTTRPSTGAGLSCTALSGSQIDCTFTAATDNVAVTGYEGHLCSDSVCTTSSIINPTWSTATSQSILGLRPGTQYYIAFKAFDAAGNRSVAFSNVVAVTTRTSIDVIPPSIMTNLRADGIYKNSVVLTWDQGTDEQGAVTTMIEQSPAGCAAFSQVVSQLALSKLVVSLAPNTSYCFRGKHFDGHNLSTDWSNTLTITTGTTGLPQPRVPVPFGQPRLPRS